MEIAGTLLVLGAVIVGLVEVLKKAFKIGSRYAPLASLLLSGILVYVSAEMSAVPYSWDTLVESLIVGLIASGLWSGAKATFQKNLSK